MLFRFAALCFIILCTSAVHSEPHIFPSKLGGTWEQQWSDEKGDIHIAITKKEGNTIHGVMTLTGSTHCTDPIPFRGMGIVNTAKIFGDAEVVCGHRGKLVGEVTRVTDDIYRGYFSYKWFGITWAKGTFELSPIKE